MRFRIFVIADVIIVIAAFALVALITQPFVSSIPSQPPQVDAARLETHVKHLSVDLFPRGFYRVRNTEQAAQYITNEFKAAGAIVTIQVVTVQDATFKNIIAHFGPATGPLLFIGAHYDSHGNASCCCA